MAHVDWEIKAREFGNCNCDYGCPCQFNALPTQGNCQAIVGYQFDAGHFGQTRLDGLRAVFIGKWPEAVHQGNGSIQLIIDERADQAQREALFKIMTGEETEAFATVFNVYATMATTIHDPIYADIEFEMNIEARTAKLAVEGLVEAVGEPIRNPVTGDEHRVRIDLDGGFEYLVAEMGSGTSKSTTGTIPMELTASYGQFNALNLNPYGIVQ